MLGLPSPCQQGDGLLAGERRLGNGQGALSKPVVQWWLSLNSSKIKGKIPALKYYELMHLIRSLSYVYVLENIPYNQKYYVMSAHVKKGGIKLVEIGKKPISVVNYLRVNGELGVVPADILPDDDMVLGLAICQTSTIWEMINHVPTPDRTQKPLLIYNLVELASCKDVLGIYAGKNESIHEDGHGIAHAASLAYRKLGDKKMLNQDSSVVLPLDFKGKFLPLMKALLVSRVIAKAPLCNANDIRGLSRAKDAFEAKGYENEDLMKLLIVTHRLWTPKRMGQFVGST